MIKLLVLQPKANDGVSWYRIVQFANYANEHKLLDIRFLDPNKFSVETITQLIHSADVFWARAKIDSGFIEFLKTKPKNKPVIVDLDDNLHLINPLSDMYQFLGTKNIKLPDGRWLWKDGEKGFSIDKNKLRLKAIEKSLQMASVVTTTTEKMKMYLNNFNDNVIVVPNCINPKVFPYLNIKRNDKTIRVGYALGSSHYEDLMSILPSLVRIVKKYPNVKYYHIGQWFGVVSKYIPKDKLVKYGWINADGHGYRMATMGLDIGICSLSNHEFNSYKSSIKFYEYSATKTATLAKESLPYMEDITDGVNGSLYYSADDFEKRLEELIINKQKRVKIANKAYDYVMKYRTIERIAPDWVKMIKLLHKTYESIAV